MGKISSLFRSRRFWIAVIGAAFVLFEENLGINLDPQTKAEITAIIISWIVGDSINKTS